MIDRVRARLPEGWTVEERTRAGRALAIVGMPGGFWVTIDIDRREFALGHGTVGHGRAAKYRGRGWLERLVDDAVAALQEALK